MFFFGFTVCWFSCAMLMVVNDVNSSSLSSVIVLVREVMKKIVVEWVNCHTYDFTKQT